MKTYKIEYFETYGGTYEIEAENENDAEEKLKHMIQEGELKGPDECQDSWSNIEPVKEIFRVKVLEEYSRVVEVMAEDADQAIEIVNDKVNNGEIDLPCDGGNYEYEMEAYLLNK